MIDAGRSQRFSFGRRIRQRGIDQQPAARPRKGDIPVVDDIDVREGAFRFVVFFKIAVLQRRRGFDRDEGRTVEGGRATAPEGGLQPVRPGIRLRAERNDHGVEREPLGLVDGHYPHGVLSVGCADGVLVSGFFPPVHEGPQG